MIEKVEVGKRYMLDGSLWVEVLALGQAKPDGMYDLYEGEVLYRTVDVQDAIEAGWGATLDGKYEAISSVNDFTWRAEPAS